MNALKKTDPAIFELIKEEENSLEIIKLNNLLDYLEVDPDGVLSRISPQLARPFGVSTDVIETRMKREKLWPPHIYSERHK